MQWSRAYTFLLRTAEHRGVLGKSFRLTPRRSSKRFWVLAALSQKPPATICRKWASRSKRRSWRSTLATPLHQTRIRLAECTWTVAISASTVTRVMTRQAITTWLVASSYFFFSFFFFFFFVFFWPNLLSPADMIFFSVCRIQCAARRAVFDPYHSMGAEADAERGGESHPQHVLFTVVSPSLDESM